MKRRPARLADVARAAGVSLATASRALARGADAGPDRHARVREAATMLGYVPHGAARALVSRRSGTIGALLPTIDNPIFASATQAMARELARASRTLLIATHEYDAQAELEAARALLERGVDGLVLVGTDHPHGIFEALDRAGVPSELIWTLDAGGFHHCVGFANREASARCATHLLDLGHRRFAVLSGERVHNDRARDRVLGVRDALSARGVPLLEERVVETSFSLRGGREGLRELWRRHGRDGFTALVCGNDLIALGALMEAAAQGLAVPESLSVVGFDDIELAAEFVPPLTTVHVPSAEIGRLAASRLLARLEGRRPPREHRLEVELVVRSTTGPVPSRQGALGGPSSGKRMRGRVAARNQ